MLKGAFYALICNNDLAALRTTVTTRGVGLSVADCFRLHDVRAALFLAWEDIFRTLAGSIRLVTLEVPHPPEQTMTCRRLSDLSSAELMQDPSVFEMVRKDPIRYIDSLASRDWAALGFCVPCVAAIKQHWDDRKAELWALLDGFLEMSGTDDDSHYQLPAVEIQEAGTLSLVEQMSVPHQAEYASVGVNTEDLLSHTVQPIPTSPLPDGPTLFSQFSGPFASEYAASQSDTPLQPSIPAPASMPAPVPTFPALSTPPQPSGPVRVLTSPLPHPAEPHTTPARDPASAPTPPLSNNSDTATAATRAIGTAPTIASASARTFATETGSASTSPSLPASAQARTSDSRDPLLSAFCLPPAHTPRYGAERPSGSARDGPVARQTATGAAHSSRSTTINTTSTGNAGTKQNAKPSATASASARAKLAATVRPEYADFDSWFLITHTSSRRVLPFTLAGVGRDRHKTTFLAQGVPTTALCV